MYFFSLIVYDFYFFSKSCWLPLMLTVFGGSMPTKTVWRKKGVISVFYTLTTPFLLILVWAHEGNDGLTIVAAVANSLHRVIGFVPYVHNDTVMKTGPFTPYGVQNKHT